MENAGRVSAQLLEILRNLPAMNVSDLHIVSNAVPRIRKDGALTNLPGATVWSAELVRQQLLGLLTVQQHEQFELNWELDFSIGVQDAHRFRVNLYRQQGTLGAAFRIIPASITELDALGLPQVVGDFAELPRGLVLVTGPTGSGKSTTLAAMVDKINHNRAVHILTIEDPIEFTHVSDKAMVNQREVGTDTLSFYGALRHVLRQDPDVILIGEMRDHETVAAALTAAETGHLVLATLHTQGAARTIDRIVDVFPPDQQDQVRTQLAMTLRGIVSQELLPHMNGSGRVVAAEVLVVNPAISNLIRENKTFQIETIMMAGSSEGMQTLDQSLATLVKMRQVSMQNAIEMAQDREALRRLVGRDRDYLADNSGIGNTGKK